MPHEIAITNGRNAMMYAGAEPPWHGLGTKLDNPPTAIEAIQAAGLDYEVASLPIFADASSRRPGHTILIDNMVMNVRTDDLRSLGVVSDRYKVVQNRECFSFLDSLVDSDELRYETAGALGDGERVWMLAKIPGDIVIPNTEDTVERRLLLYNSHDGSSALRILWTPTRVVCANTANFALKQGEGRGYTIQHTGNMEAKVEEARKVLGLAVTFFEGFGEGASLLAGHRPTEAQLASYFSELYPDPTKGDPARTKAIRMSLFGLFERGKGNDMKGVQGTTWAAYNAVTEYVDHHIAAGRTTDETVARRRRLESAWWGDGAKVKEKAWTLALDLAGAGVSNN